MPSLQDALAYAFEGCTIIPVWPGDGEGNCTCGTNCGKSKAKHPIACSVHDATSDPDIISGWWAKRPQAGIGVALGKDLISLDVDHNEAAQRILAKPPQGFAIDQSPHGCHLWFSGSLQNTYVLKDTAGNRLGELRGHGAYVIAPPSINASGVPYVWRSGGIRTMRAVLSVDPVETARTIFASVGIELENPADRTSVEGMPDAIEAIGVPFDTKKHRTLNQLLKGTYTVDRSGALWKLAHELVESAGKEIYPLTAVEVAGVLKKADQVVASYHKYTGRRDADEQYWTIATKVFTELEERKKQPKEKKDTGPQPAPEQLYFYNEKEGLILAGVRTTMKLANFKPEIIEQITVDTGDEKLIRFLVELSKPGVDNTLIELTPTDMSSPSKLLTAFYSQVGPGYILYPEGPRHLYAAMQELSLNIKHSVRLSQIGWVSYAGEDIFLLPGMPFGINSSGMNEDVHFEGATELTSSIQRYGLNVRVPTEHEKSVSITNAFVDLLDAADPVVLMPLIVQVLSGPLTSWCLNENPPLIHVEGMTGSFKTTIATLCLSLLGDFNGGQVPASWISTVNSLQYMLYVCKDLTLIIDDYKESSIKNKAELTRFLQTYADRTTRDRLTPDQRLRKSYKPRSLLISTGEDDWNDQQSLAARTVVVKAHRSLVDTSKLKIAQQQAEDGMLAAIGGAYLYYLARLGSERIKTLYDEWYDKFHSQLIESLSGSHFRSVSVLASIFACERIIRAFVKAEFPQVLGLYTEKALTALNAMMRRGVSQVEDTQELSPLNKLVDAVIQGLISRELTLEWFDNSTNTEYINGYSLGKIVGFYDTEHVYFNQGLTYDWYLQHLTASRQSATFSWAAVIDEAETGALGKSSQFGFRMNRRFLKLKRSVINEAVWEELDDR